jgi:hypothetical protein
VRDLTEAESGERERRRMALDAFLSERMPVLADFAEKLSLPTPPKIVARPDEYLDAIDRFMRDQVVTTDDGPWIQTRLGYFIGELLIQKFWGCWFLNEIPDSRYFLRYVVGRFARLKNPNAMVDSFEIAYVYLNEPPGRSLKNLLTEVESELQRA